MKDADRRDANRGSTPIVMLSDSAGSPAWWNSQSDFTPGCTHFVQSASRGRCSRATPRCRGDDPAATAIVRSVSSVVSPIRHLRFEFFINGE